MPTNTYTPLANITLGSSAASVTFSSISQAYRDLIVIYNGETVSSGAYDIRFILNGVADTNHFVVVAGGSGSSTFSFTASNSSNLFNLGAGNQSVGVFQVMDYSATDKHKTTLIRLNAATAGTGMAAQRWASTSAVTSVAVGIGSGNFAAGSTFSLFGVAA